MYNFKKSFAFVFLILYLRTDLFAFIYDNNQSLTNIDGFKIQNYSKTVDFLINNKKIKIRSFITDSHQGDVIGYYLDYAEKKKFKIVDSKYTKMLANIFLSSDKSFYNPDFDYVFYIDENKAGNLVAASTNFEKTDVVIVKIHGNINTKIDIKKINDLKLPEDIKGLLYIKIPGEKSKYNVFYCGFFDSPNFNYVTDRWLKKLKNEKWQMTDLKSKNINNKFLFFEKNKKEYFVTISLIENKLYISIIG